MTKGILLSYASQDTDAARRICDALRSVGRRHGRESSTVHVPRDILKKRFIWRYN